MKKFLSGILSMVLLISCLTISAFAAEAPKMVFGSGGNSHPAPEKLNQY